MQSAAYERTRDSLVVGKVFLAETARPFASTFNIPNNFMRDRKSRFRARRDEDKLARARPVRRVDSVYSCDAVGVSAVPRLFLGAASRFKSLSHLSACPASGGHRHEGQCRAGDAAEFSGELQFGWAGLRDASHAAT